LQDNEDIIYSMCTRRPLLWGHCSAEHDCLNLPLAGTRSHHEYSSQQYQADVIYLCAASESHVWQEAILLSTRAPSSI